MKPDIFDLIAPDEDVFDDVEQEDSAVENIKAQVATLLETFDAKDRKKESRKLSDEIKEFIREEVAKIKPRQNVIERQIEQIIKHEQVPVHLEPKVIQAPPAPPQIIKEVRIEVQKVDPKKYVEESKYLDLLVKIAKLEGQIKETRRMAESPIVLNPGGSGVIGIPPPEPHEGKTLKVLNGKAAWLTGGGGASISGYTINDATTLKDLPADASLDDLRQVLGTLITELQA